MPFVFNDPEHWRERAREARELADQMSDAGGAAKTGIQLTRLAQPRDLGLMLGIERVRQRRLDLAAGDQRKAKSGKEFDQAYDQMQRQAHEDAVALFKSYSQGGDNADLKAWATKTLPHLKEHLAMAKKLS
jgi:predicted outer membrane protein